VIFFRTFAYIFKQRSLNNKIYPKRWVLQTNLKTNTNGKKSMWVFYQNISERMFWTQNHHGVRPCKKILHDGGHVK
jgi:hypothetical protein